MSYDDIKTIWSNQGLPASAGAPTALREHIRVEFQHRRRFLIFITATAFLGIILNQLFYAVNMAFAYHTFSVIRFVQIVLVEAVNITIFIRLLRRLKQIREVRRKTGEALSSALTASLDYLKTELIDFRLMQWFLPAACITLTFTSVYINNPVHQVGWQPFLLRIGMTAGVLVPIVLALWRHYRQNLLPEYHRLQQILAELHD
jgi:hypothetical protein